MEGIQTSLRYPQPQDGHVHLISGACIECVGKRVDQGVIVTFRS